MTVLILTPEMNDIGRRTRRMLGVSVGIHVLLLLLMSIYKQIEPEAVSLTEITWLEPGQGDGEPAGLPSSAPPPPARQAQEPGLAVKTFASSEHFVRETSEDADYEPDPQSEAATDDRISERLASMQSSSARPALSPSVGLPGPSVGLASMGGMGVGSGLPGSGGTSQLNRGGTGSGGGGTVVPLEMKRSGTRPAPAVATVAPKIEEKPAAPRKSSEGVAAQRTLAGSTLLGPVADRQLLNFVQPRYPDWAKNEGVEATVRIYFVVLENGTLKENVVIQKTSGYQDFDANAVEALRSWRFEPLPTGSAGEQWGEITFRYRLSGGSSG
jgi:TonB family protein